MEATVSHFEIPAQDLERATAFFRKVFGWRVEALPWEGPAYFKVRTAREGGTAPSGPRGAIDGGLMGARDLGSSHPLLVIHVKGASLEAALEKIVAAGGTVEEPPTRVGEMGSFARFRDPEGNLWGLWEEAGG